MTKSTITRKQTQQIIVAADEVITALAGTNEDVHPDDSKKMCELWDDLNDRHAPPVVVRELARMALAAMDSEPVGSISIDRLLQLLYQFDGANECAASIGDQEYALECGDVASALRELLSCRSALPVADVVAWSNPNEERKCDIRWRRHDVEPGPLYRHPQPAPVEATVVDDVKTIIRILNDNDWSDTEGFRGIKTHIGKSLESWIDRIIDQIKPSGLRPDEIKKYIRETLIENGLYDGLRLALSNAGIAAPESDEMLAVKQERYVQELVTWVRDRKPFQPPPVVPDGYVMVPKEPTKEMLDEFDSIIDYGAEDSQDAWRRLLAAAPQSPGSEPATVPGKWIPVSERLPENKPGGYEYLVFETLNGCVNHDYWAVPDTGQEFTPFWNRYGDYVTHWMPLPAAPQEVSDA